MGLSTLILSYSENTLINNGTLDEYYNEFILRYERDLLNLNQFALQDIEKTKPAALEDAVLISFFLKNDDDYLTTTEIAKLINKTFYNWNIEKSKNNVSRYFNQCFYPYYEAVRKNNVNRYRLSQTGRMHALWLLRKKHNKIKLII